MFKINLLNISLLKNNYFINSTINLISLNFRVEIIDIIYEKKFYSKLYCLRQNTFFKYLR